MKKTYIVEACPIWDVREEYKCDPEFWTYGEIQVECGSESDLKNELIKKIESDSGWPLKDIEYEILSIKVPLNKEQKKTYINSYEEDDFKKIFEKLIELPWAIEYFEEVPQGHFDCDLVITHSDGNESVEDELTKEWVKELLGITF